MGRLLKNVNKELLQHLIKEKLITPDVSKFKIKISNT